MRTGAVHLSVDVGAFHTAGVVVLPDGRRVPLTPDGAPIMRSGAFVDPDSAHLTAGAQALAASVTQPDCYVTDVKGHLAAGAVNVAGRTVETVDLAATLLKHIGEEAARTAAQPLTGLTLTVPVEWGPRRRSLLRQAAARAGLPEPDLIAEPVAVAEHLAAVTGGRPPPGACVLVCDAGATAVRLSLLQIEPVGALILATLALPGGGGDAIDAALIAQVRAGPGGAKGSGHEGGRPPTVDDPRPPPAVIDAARQAKEALLHSERTLLALPPPQLPAVVEHAHLDAIVDPVRKRLSAAVGEVLEAADATREHLAAVILTGGGARLPGLAATLNTATGMPPLIPARTDLACADGATAPTAPARAPAAADTALPRARLRLQHLVTPCLVGAASLAVLAQMLTTAEVRTDFLRTTSVRAATELIAVAGLLVMLTAYAIAYLAPTTLLTGTTEDTAPTTGSLIRRSYTLAAALGVAVAGIYGLFAGAYYGLTDPAYPRLAVLAATPTAIAALVIAVAGPRIAADRVTTWLATIRPPVTGVLLAASGTVLMRYANTVSPSLAPVGTGIILSTGAAAVGVGIALTITRQRLVRTFAATVLGIGAAVSATYDTTSIITTAYPYAVAWWAATVTALTANAAAPSIGQVWRMQLFQSRKNN